jgi:predicted nucleic acid-binding protein
MVLAHGGSLDLLHAICGNVAVPGAVAKKVLSGPRGDPAAEALRTKPGLQPEEVPVSARVVARWDLEAGEAEVLTWAVQHPGSEAILDDRLVRRCACAPNVPVQGTIGVLLLAKKRGLIPAARPALDALAQAGLFISPELREQALRLVRE